MFKVSGKVLRHRAIQRTSNHGHTTRRSAAYMFYIYEVESRAGYPESGHSATFWGFFIYILLFNVKNLLSVV